MHGCGRLALANWRPLLLEELKRWQGATEEVDRRLDRLIREYTIRRRLGDMRA